MSTLPGRTLEPSVEPTRGGNAVLGKSVIVKGQIVSREDLTIDGEVEGTVELQEHRLTIGPNGKVKANIKAREVAIFGAVKGNIEATEKIAIREKGSLIGDIKTAGISIDDGAYFKGSIDIVRPEGDVLDALALVFVEVFLYLTLVVLTFVDRDADLAARRSQGARKQTGLLALDAEVADFPEVEQLFVVAGP